MSDTHKHTHGTLLVIFSRFRQHLCMCACVYDEYMRQYRQNQTNDQIERQKPLNLSFFVVQFKNQNVQKESTD